MVMDTGILTFFAGINIAFALLAFLFVRGNQGERFYLYFGIFSLFSGLYFLLGSIENLTAFNLSVPIITSAAVYYGIFPWFISEFIGRQFIKINIGLTSIFLIAVLFYIIRFDGALGLIWQVLAHAGLLGLIAVSIYASYFLFKRREKGAAQLILITILFSFLGGEEILSEYTQIDILQPLFQDILPLDIYPILFTIIFGIRLYDYFLEKQNLEFKLVQSELVEKSYELEVSEKKRLELELKGKNMDLTDLGIDLMRKKDFATDLYQRILKIKNNNPEINDLSDLLKTVKLHLQIDDELHIYHKNIEAINHRFISSLQDRFPTLSRNEIQLASMLRLGLSSKQIAEIKNVAPESVKVLRYRLRKKLKLEQKEDLSVFLQKFK